MQTEFKKERERQRQNLSTHRDNSQNDHKARAPTLAIHGINVHRCTSYPTFWCSLNRLVHPWDLEDICLGNDVNFLIVIMYIYIIATGPQLRPSFIQTEQDIWLNLWLSSVHVCSWAVVQNNWTNMSGVECLSVCYEAQLISCFFYLCYWIALSRSLSNVHLHCNK